MGRNPCDTVAKNDATCGCRLSRKMYERKSAMTGATVSGCAMVSTHFRAPKSSPNSTTSKDSGVDPDRRGFNSASDAQNPRPNCAKSMEPIALEKLPPDRIL